MSDKPASGTSGCLLLGGGLLAAVATLFLACGGLALAGVVPVQIGPQGWVILTLSLIGLPAGVAMARAGWWQANQPARPPEDRADDDSPAEFAVEPWTGSGEDWPTVPDVATRPGSTLAHALNRAALPFGCRFGCAVLATAVLAGLAWWFTGPTVRPALQGQWPEWWPGLWHAALLLGLVGTTLGAVVAGVRWVAASLAGRLAVEVGDHPLVPGRPVRVSVAQAGAVPIRRLTVRLVCTEEATYVQGTNRRTERREVAEHPVDGAGGDRSWAGEVVLPAGTMHSFAAKNNKIGWVVRVSGRILGVAFADDFAVAVRPG